MPIPSEDDLTIGPVVATRSPPAGPSSPATPRFVPGAIVAGRYRLVALLGRGGMGEVYRADDLTLDHPVALKFLPEGVAHDGARLAQFHNELRIAREVSHKNVCRLYDLGEADGRPFLTMEYVDGEDLASLLRRIGRLPQDKAVEIARQLCAGVAAAHERGVLHRDLKPANVMIDGDGAVRIADFGLAIGNGAVGADHAGTPQYMAPEQLAGQPASVKSDIFALGLILFEMFTGKRAYDAKTLTDLVQLHESGTFTTPSSVVRDLDPAVERVILRCVERDPTKRPASAIAVAAALPGGDPLAAALAAGETPSPEMVAAAGETSALSPAIGLSLFLFVIVGLIAVAALADRFLLVARVPMEKSPDALEDRAREMLQKLGYTERPADTARGVGIDFDYLTYVARTDRSSRRWDGLSGGAMPTVRFWFRTSPRDLVPLASDWTWQPDVNDPPLVISNMATVVLDPRGRLAELVAVPPQVDDSPPSTGANWARLFEAAGLPLDAFRPGTPRWLPRMYADERAAWDGSMPDQPEIPLHVEASAYRGRPVYFHIVGPWTRPTRMQQEPRSATSRVLGVIATLILVALLVGTVALARNNLRIGRGDRRGAARASLFVLAIWIAAWALGARHALDMQTEFRQFMDTFLAFAVLNAGLMWLLYVALEPYVRRYCPHMLFSWTRLVAGQLRDPRVGRDILIGVSVGVLLALLRYSTYVIPSIAGSPSPIPKGVNMQFLLGARFATSTILKMIPNALQNTMAMTFIFVVVRAVSGRVWPAVVAAGLLFGVLVVGEMNDLDLVALVFAVSFSVVLVTTLVKFGLLAQAAAFFTNMLLGQGVLTIDASKLYAANSVWLIVLVAGLAAFGLYASRGGEPLFGKLLPRE